MSEGAGRLPDFVIVGAMKAGTTSLAAWLRAHPQVFMTEQKELHFFDRFWDNGVDWYRARFEAAPAEAIAGEATPSYMVLPRHIERMASVVPDARLIAILRNPVDRAWSQHKHSVARGDEQRSFDEAVHDGILADPTDWRTGGGIVARGRYIGQLRNLTAAFDRAQIHVGLFDDLAAKPHDFFATVCTFLDVDASVQPSVVGEVFDPFAIDRAVTRTREALEIPAGGRVTWRSRRPFRRRSSEPEPRASETMTPAIRETLIEYFRPYNDELAAWLGIDLSAWNG